MMKKVVVLLMAITLSLAGCNSAKSFNVSTSYFDHYIGEQTDAAYTIKGTVFQENDENAILVHIRAEKNAAISMTGAMAQVSGGDTQIVYVAPDGTQTKIADNSIEKIDSTINVLLGDGTVKFIGESAVYDFDIEFGLADGVSYSDL